ncbi:MAG: PEP/pyruvate-binding domain-containing protein, partial [Desulforhopalus sp.]
FEPLRRLTTSLNLIDPEAGTFIPEHCRSLHDIVRFCHEKSVREMFGFGGGKTLRLTRTRRLKTHLPLAMYVLDLEQTIVPIGKTIALEELASLPLHSFWRGLTDDRISWDHNLPHLDWEEFDRISGGIFSLHDRILASYAIVSNDYLHLDIRFGYHFSIVDAICSSRSEENYINFRFKGGGAAHDQRLHRLEFLDRVLTAWRFETSRHGDALDAACSRLARAETAHSLTRLGLLLAATRLMDIKLHGSDQARREAEEFIGFADQNCGIGSKT